MVWVMHYRSTARPTSRIFIAGAVRRDMNSARIGWHSGNYMTADSAISVLCIRKRRLRRNSRLAGFLKQRVCRREEALCRETWCGRRESNSSFEPSGFSCRPQLSPPGCETKLYSICGSRLSLCPFPDGLGLRCCSSSPCACQFRNARGSREKRAYSLHTASPRMQSLMGRL